MSNLDTIVSGGAGYAEFQVVECFPFDVNVTFEKEGQQVTAALFPKGTHIPSAKMLTFIRYATLSAVSVLPGFHSAYCHAET